MTDVLVPPSIEVKAIELESGAPAPRPRGRAGRFVRGRPEDPAWVRPTLLALLAGTALLYLWGLGASGWANSYYSAAVQAGTKSWKASFFGSVDSANSITVDKSPASLWVMVLSARIFGLNSWSVLVPQALEGVAAVGVLYLAVRRWFTPAAGLIAGAIMATTPVAVLMFRFNNPDALLVLLMTLAAYATTRAIEQGRTTWLVLAFTFAGFGFLAKMLQALLVVPVFALVYLLAAPPRFLRRLWQLALGGVALLVSAGWWVAIVELWPASSRPYIGGSRTNSVLDLIFGYNGFGRLTGNETGSVGGRGAQGSMWGATGLSRLFKNDWGGQASWLLPAALVLMVAVLSVTARRPRTDRTRAAMLLWGGSLVTTALAFSLGQGIIHQYYSVALAPLLGAVVGIGIATFWSTREELASRAVLVTAFAVAVGWSWWLLDRTPTWNPWLRPLLVVAGVVLCVALLTLPASRTLTAAGAVAVAVALAGSGAYALTTASTPHRGAIPLAGPAGLTAFGGPGGAPGTGGFAGGAPPNFAGGTPPNFAGGAPPNFAGGAAPNRGGGVGRGPGGLLDATSPSSAVVELLRTDASEFRWVAATVGANNAAGYQLGSDEAVMAIGGFNGSDPSPTLAGFRALVDEGRIHYFIAGGMGGGGPAGGMGASGPGSAISAWVQEHYQATTVGGVTLYDLTRPLA
ncbi:MAG: glycosyltransferase family 39 protein [Acidimicrobiia bacterium]